MTTTDTKTTTWRFTHWYPNKDDSKQLKGEYMMRGHQQGSILVLQSEPDSTGAYLLVRLNIDGNVASGSWHERAADDSEVGGREYSGAGQLIISEDGEQMEGLWVGAGFDHGAKQLRLYTDKWEIIRVPDPES